MSQTETPKAEGAEERTEETRSSVRRVSTATRRKYTPEEKIRIVLEGFRREVTVSDLCRREGTPTMHGPRSLESLPTEEAKANTTDPDSRIMKTRQGYVQGYNAQAVVSEEQIIVAVGVTQEANDVQQLEPMLQTMAHTLKAAGIEDRPKAGLADAGYWSEANIRACS